MVTTEGTVVTTVGAVVSTGGTVVSTGGVVVTDRGRGSAVTTVVTTIAPCTLQKRRTFLGWVQERAFLPVFVFQCIMGLV